MENAILHGISRKTGNVTIRIVAERRHSRLVCWVIDSGRGFDTTALDLLRGEAHALPMLHGRLSNIYGGRFGLKIRSRPGKGTLVHLWLPVTDEAKQL